MQISCTPSIVKENPGMYSIQHTAAAAQPSKCHFQGLEERLFDCKPLYYVHVVGNEEF